MSRRRDEEGDDARRPQLAIWDDEGRESSLGTFVDGDAEWELRVVLEPASADLFRGRLSFRRGEERIDTAPVLVEDSADAVRERAAQLPHSMLRQLFISARG